MRLNYLDYLRALAIVWMIIFHATYDFNLYGLNQINFSEGFWYAFARLIAGTFLFCVGISLKLVHGQKINKKSLIKRSLKLGGSALIISLVTYFLFPERWVYFGTLHCIFTASILGSFLAPYPKTSWILLVLILIAQYGLGFDIKWVSSILERPSMDFIPLYPWFWVVLLGMNLSPYLERVPILTKLAPSKMASVLSVHSLKIYLLHQPILYAFAWSIKWLISR